MGGARAPGDSPPQSICLFDLQLGTLPPSPPHLPAFLFRPQARQCAPEGRQVRGSWHRGQACGGCSCSVVDVPRCRGGCGKGFMQARLHGMQPRGPRAYPLSSVHGTPLEPCARCPSLHTPCRTLGWLLLWTQPLPTCPTTGAAVSGEAMGRGGRGTAGGAGRLGSAHANERLGRAIYRSLTFRPKDTSDASSSAKQPASLQPPSMWHQRWPLPTS